MLKNLQIYFVFISISLHGYSQSYLGTTINQANLRGEPSKNSTIINKLARNSDIFIVSITPVNDFYNVIYIAKNQEGYIHKSLVTIDGFVPRSNESVFTPSGKSAKYDPDVKIHNNTSKNLTLRLNTILYSFEPHQTRILTIAPGPYDFMASAPGVQPYLGSENITNNTDYSWTFYIVTSSR